MPVRAARAFVMREVMELSTEEICKALGVTATNSRQWLWGVSAARTSASSVNVVSDMPAAGPDP